MLPLPLLVCATLCPAFLPRPDEPDAPQPFPDLMPLLPWMLGLMPEENPFLEACLLLAAWPPRICLYLSFYAELGLRDIYCFRNSLTDETWSPILHDLEHSYLDVVRGGQW